MHGTQIRLIFNKTQLSLREYIDSKYVQKNFHEEIKYSCKEQGVMSNTLSCNHGYH